MTDTNARYDVRLPKPPLPRRSASAAPMSVPAGVTRSAPPVAVTPVIDRYDVRLPKPPLPPRRSR